MSYLKDKNQIKKLIVSFDSLFRTDYNNTVSSDFTFALPTPIENVVSMKVTSVELPYSWYEFSQIQCSNEFTITTYNYTVIDPVTQESTIMPSTTYQIKLPPGNYDSSQLKNALNNYFINTGGGLGYLYIDINISTTKTIIRALSPTDQNYTMTPYDSTSVYYSPDFYFTLDFRIQANLERPLYMNMGWILGFKQPQYTVNFANTYTDWVESNIIGNEPIIYNSYIESESSYGFSVANYVFLYINDNNKSFTNDSITSYFGNSISTNNNILARLTITTSQNAINFTNGGDFIFKSRDYYGAVNIDTLHIRLLDRFGNILNLEGNDFSFLLEFSLINV